MLLENLVHFVGALLKHLIGVLLLCWRRMLRAGLIAFFIGVVVTVLVTVVFTGKAIPSGFSLIVALLLGLALAYGVALTVMVEEMILGVIDLIKMLEGDVAAGAHIAEVVAEREVGQVGQGLRRLAGLPVSERGPARPGAVLPPMPRSPAPRTPVHRFPLGGVEVGAAAAGVAAVAGAALAKSRHADLEAEEELAPTTPDLPPGEPGAPVPAARLPRISWTLEHEAVRPPAPSVPGAVAGGAAFSPAPGLTPNDSPSDPPPLPSPPIPAVEPLSPPAPVASVAPASTTTETLPYELAPSATGSLAAQSLAAESLAAEPIATVAEPVAEATHPVASEIVAEEPERPEWGLGGLLGAGALGTLAEMATGVVASHALELFTHHRAAEPEVAEAEPEPYEDERLAAPVSVTTPEGPAEPAERVDAPDGLDEPTVAAAPPQPEAPPALMGQPAPATTPLEPQKAEAAIPAAPTPTVDYPFQVMPEPTPEPPTQPAPATTPFTSPQARAAADTRPIAPAAEPEPAPAAADSPIAEAPVEAPEARGDGARRTFPLGGAGALDRSDGATPSAPRASAPESGLWERLSSALINRVSDRAGAPSGPFAPTPGGDQAASDGGADAEVGEPER